MRLPGNVTTGKTTAGSLWILLSNMCWSVFQSQMHTLLSLRCLSRTKQTATTRYYYFKDFILLKIISHSNTLGFGARLLFHVSQ